MKCKGKITGFLLRVGMYIVGLILLAFGVAFSVNSNLGVSPVNSLPYVISRIAGIDMGTCVVAVFSCYIVIQMLLLRRRFHLINLTQILFSTVFGCFVDLAKGVLGDFALPTYLGQLAMLVVSILLVAAGICLYMDVELVNMPMEGMTHAVNETLFPQLPFHDVKVMMDCLAVGVGVVLSLMCLGHLDGIREGTILCAVLVGKIMKPLQNILRPVVRQICVMD